MTAADELVARLIEGMQEGRDVVLGWDSQVLAGSPICAGIVPTRGLVSGIAEPLRTVAREYVGGHEFSTTVAGRTTTLRFWTYAHNPIPLEMLRKYAGVCFVWLVMLVPCNASRAGSKSCVCDFLMLPDKRQYPEKPGDAMGKLHCNGGMSYVGPEHAEFCVYRQEELFKVFVHETFHAFAAHGQFPGGREARDLTGLSTRLGLEYSEVYAETWARIILVLFARGAEGVESVQEGLRVESEHGWRNCLCVLPRVAINAAKRQATPAFEYYCLTGVAMIHHNEFLEWCALHNRECGNGVGFELRDPALWLRWLGEVAREELGYAGYLLASGDDRDCGAGSRMTSHDVF